jgi:hypothetical protein
MSSPTLLRSALLCAAAMAFASAMPARAQDDATPTPSRTIVLTVYGADGSPVARSSDEIVVCSRRPESERYRIPRRFRNRGDRPLEIGWGARAMDLEEAQRDTRPNSCSVNGSWGQSGCTQQLIRQWYAERRQAQAQRDAERGY